MSLTLALLCFLFATCICILLVNLARAPGGYEDDQGFRNVRAVKSRRIASADVHSIGVTLSGR
jgi:hypothetical protein